MASIKHNPERDFTPQFMAKVAGWIREHGEVFIVLRYLCGAGNKDYLFCHSAEEFDKLVERLPEGTDTIVFEQRQLPLRGVCTHEFIETALKLIADGEEFIVAMLRFKEPSHMRTSWSMGDTHEDLKESLLDFIGEEVAVGPCPDFFVADHASMISASKGGIDGPR